MRPRDWSPVGLGEDPVPGDPAYVRYGGEQYLDVARAIDRTVQGLRSLQLDGTESQAVSALADSARTVSDDIAKAEARYRATGNALIAYAGALEQAQSQADQALARADVAQSEADAARGDRSRYLRLADAAEDQQEALRYTRLAEGQGAEGEGARARIAGARDDVLDARRFRDAAAQEARDRIEDTTSGDGLKDSWWDNWGADMLAVITDVAGWVSAVAGILALAVSWIPVVGQALAAALLLVAGIAAVVNAIGNIVLASTGERGWGEAVVSIIGAALSVVGLGAAARLLGNLASANRINAAARLQPGFAGADNLLTVRDAMRLRPSAMSESERLWRAPLPTPSVGDDVYRVYGRPPGVAFDDAAHAWGASYSPTPPWQFTHVRESLGLPSVNAADNLLIARVTDPDANRLVRHALPLDGNPGGAAEYIFPGRFGDPGKGVDIVDNLVFTVR
ncbi:hypothetical protein QNO21_12410 [Microbacterium sp. zg-Y818]|uniref:putative T7SS-secreted protein n=1 Tax=unclassified Microbacterium TaxID=2609290 RepID=UPI00214B6C81|nr:MULTISPECIES: hypothetical protein [unclassified Microbacterium]MCR2799926.1 hypothetical protein [Microbacterium sp. zg.Y818]WIM21905.1 hypothetical protein QNO21_12410 [Microbacterium sp. zg-Y818]